MAIKQRIEFASDAAYFGGFLQALIDESGVVASLEQRGAEITLYIEDSEPSTLEQFVQNTQKYLPHSLFLGEIESSWQEEYLPQERFISPSYPISLCQKCLRELHDPASSEYLNQDLVCRDYSNEDGVVFEDPHYYSPHYTKGSSLLVVDPQALSKLFSLTQKEIETLYSIEKPSLKVRIADSTLMEICGSEFIAIKAPSTLKSTLVALNAKESEIEYLFFMPQELLEVAVSKESVRVIRDALGVSRSLERFVEEPLLNRFVNIAMELERGEKTLGAYLNQKGEVAFFYRDTKEHKRLFSFNPFDLDTILCKMREDATQKRLLANFFAAYPLLERRLQESSKLDIFELLATILELDIESYDALSSCSLLFYGNGGLKIDMNFKDGNFDYAAMVGSVMSFRLAGTPKDYLAYSIFEAFADMIIATLLQLKAKYGVEQFVMMGAMFENSVLYSRVLSRFSQHKPHFSKGFALDD